MTVRGHGAPGLAIVLGLCLLFPTQTVEANQTRPEYEVKAAYLLNFARYVTWPQSTFEDADSPIVIGILGHDDFNGSLRRVVSGRTSGGRPMVIRRLRGVDDVEGCHIVFLGRGVEDQARLLERISDRPILTVGESSRFLRDGGAIELVIVRDTVQFGVNLRATDRARLNVSARTLRVARWVVGEEGRGSFR